MSDTCGWCGSAISPEGRRRYCPRPRSCRQAAYRDRRRAAAAFRARAALFQIGGEIRDRCEALELALADAIAGQHAEAGLHSTAAADFAHLTRELVRVAVIADRAAGATWEEIGRPHELTADAARARWGHLGLIRPPESFAP
ncbi:hypothetical protein [Streptomyces marianii]|uniref:Uncharacterized protein n=1 Tax=Streptomyces marianii TaxID=1817406 RepID=A0A5R9DUL7_9ACTN|nr:hypothetical protein [Streptomyces marianii]TLQ38634.1 hypothetical protein FEF34_40875 [Streptomyces marianii]